MNGGLLGRRLRQRRETLNLAREAVSTFVGVSVSQIRRYEEGETVPSPARLNLLAEFLDIPVDNLLEGFENGDDNDED